MLSFQINIISEHAVETGMNCAFLVHISLNVQVISALWHRAASWETSTAMASFPRFTPEWLESGVFSQSEVKWVKQVKQICDFYLFFIYVIQNHRCLKVFTIRTHNFKMKHDTEC